MRSPPAPSASSLSPISPTSSWSPRRPRRTTCRDSDEFKRRQAFLRNKLLMGTMLQAQAKDAATDEEMHKVYDDAVKPMAAEEEVHARHILVETEDEAKAIVEQLKGGADFATLAKEKSKDPGAADGGDLGFFAKGQMVPEFSEVAFKMYPGQVSNPVKTQFGWHIIKLEDKRTRAGAGVRQGQGPDRGLCRAQGADRVRRAAARDRQDRAPRPSGRRPPAAAPQPSAAPAAPANRPRTPVMLQLVDECSPLARLRRELRSALSGRERATAAVRGSRVLARSRPCPPKSPRSLPQTVPDMPAIDGVRLATAAAGIRYQGRTDVLLAVLDPGTAVAGVFTQSKCASAPVEWCRDQLKGRTARALVVNSGNANAFTGKTGREACQVHRATRRHGRRLQARRSLPRLDRRDRRAARCASVRRRDGDAGRQGRRRRLARRRPRDHDHRHVPQGRDRHGRDRRDDGHHQRHRQGRRHDRAGHGDHAVVRVHRRADRRRARCRAC